MIELGLPALGLQYWSETHVLKSRSVKIQDLQDDAIPDCNKLIGQFTWLNHITAVYVHNYTLWSKHVCSVCQPLLTSFYIIAVGYN